MYNKRVMEEFINPQNVGIVKKSNAVGKVANPACGDTMKLYLRINENGIIEDAGFKTLGCAAAIAASSITTQLVIGKSIQESLQIRHTDILDVLGGLPIEKIHCSLLAEEAIEASIEDYYKKLEKQKRQQETIKSNAEETE